MRQIILDGSAMSSLEDLYEALIVALGGPDWHGRNLNAFIDSMATGDINQVEPPYEVLVVNAGDRPRVREAVELLSSVLREARAERRGRLGDDVEVGIRLA